MLTLTGDECLTGPARGLLRICENAMALWAMLTGGGSDAAPIIGSRCHVVSDMARDDLDPDGREGAAPQTVDHQPRRCPLPGATVPSAC